MRRAWGHRPVTPVVAPSQRDAVRVRLLCDERVAEYIVQGFVDASHPAAKPVSVGAEHMFVRVGEGSDGKAGRRERGPRRPTYAADPSDEEMSMLVRIRSMTALVKSPVLLDPPRSGVLIPEPTVSSADS